MAWLPIAIIGYYLSLADAAPTNVLPVVYLSFAPASTTVDSVATASLPLEVLSSIYDASTAASSSQVYLESPTPTPSSSVTMVPATTLSLETTTPEPVITATPDITTITFTVTLEPSSTLSDVPSPTSWIQPHRFSNLAAFNISNFAYGDDNLDLVGEIPPQAYARPNLRVAQVEFDGIQAPLPPLLSNRPTVPSLRTLSESDPTLLQLFYPERSINPSHPTRPQGGADFYANPLQEGILHGALNVTLGYSVFFPAGFEFALGGKLPGLYGGHERCSGGDDAQSCFSTRLMWRKGGMGELYLVCPLPFYRGLG